MIGRTERPATLVELLGERARREPSRWAFSFLNDAGAEVARLTYGELDQQARAIAAWLQARLGEGERALLAYPPGLEFVAAFFGCLYAGVLAVPVHPPRNERTLPRLRAVVDDAGAGVVLTAEAFLAKTAPASRRVSELGGLAWQATDAIPAEAAGGWREPTVGPDALAFLQYTSGSTSTPNGVMVSHGNALHNSTLVYRRFRHGPDSVGVIWLPAYHDMGLIGGVLQPVFGGFPCVFMAPATFVRRPALWLQAVSRYRATTSGGPNFAYDLCARAVSADEAAGLDLRSWSVAFNGSEPVRHETLARFAAAFAPYGFRREAFYPCYGLAEGTLFVAGATTPGEPRVRRLRRDALERNRAVEAEDGSADSRDVVSCGRADPEQEVALVDPERGVRCAPGEIGEIWVSGPSVARGYWNRPEESRRTFGAVLADRDGRTFLRTGDLGFVRDGELFVTGRLKDLIVIQGRNHYPQDIELTAERSHPALRPGGGAAFAVEANGQERLVLVHEVERRPNAEMTSVLGAIRLAVAREHELELYAALLVPPGSVPRTSSGKVQRRACQARYLARELGAVAGWPDPGLSYGHARNA